MAAWIPIAILLAAAAKPPVIVVRKLQPMAAAQPQASGTFTLTVSPATISFSATNPGTLPVVAGSAAATASWTALGSGNTWTLTVQAASPTFSNCSTVPISAVTVSCSSVSVVGLGGSGTCAGSFPLSTTPQTVASGSEGLVSLTYSVTISFTLNDSWKYIAETSPACTLSLTYTANVP
jgi:hypothetical protein